MKVYVFYPTENVCKNMGYSIEEDGCPFTNNKILADMFDEQRNRENIFNRVTKNMTREEYGQLIADYALMEIILYPCVDDVHNREMDEFPKAGMVNIPMLRIEKDSGDEGIGMLVDCWEPEHYIPDADEFKPKLRNAMHTLSFYSFLYFNIGSEFKEPEYELNTMEWFKENGSYFSEPPF